MYEIFMKYIHALFYTWYQMIFRFYHFILITIYDLDINELIDANVHIKYSEL